MPNILSNFGLAMQGADAAQAVDQAEIQRQQQIDTGKIGLEDAQFNQGVKRATRAAGAAAAAAGKPLSGSFLDMSDAAAAQGDVSTATAYRDAYQKLKTMGATELAHEALTNPTPGDRPDLVAILKRNGTTQDATGANLDDKGNLTVTTTSGKNAVFNIGVMAERLGLVKPPTIHNIPAGGVGVVTGPGRDPSKPENQISTPRTYPPAALNTKVEKIQVKDADGNERSYLWNLETKDWEGDKPPAGTATPGAANVRKDLPVLNDITKGITELGEEYGKTDMSNPLNPKITLTQKGQQVALVAEQIRMANQQLAPRTIIELATKGKPMWKVENGNRTGVVLYNNQEYPMSTPTGKAQPAAPAASASPTTPAAAPAAPAPVEAAPVTAPTAAPAARANPGGERKYDEALEAKDPDLKRMGNLLRLGVKDPNLDVQTWIKYAQRAKQLGSKNNYAKGGKVQRYGLGQV